MILEDGIVVALGGMPTTSGSPHSESVVVACAPFETRATSLTGKVVAPLEIVSVFVTPGIELVAAIFHFNTENVLPADTTAATVVPLAFGSSARTDDIVTSDLRFAY